MKIAGVVILYNPDKSWSDNIMTYLGFIEKLIIIDNSPKPMDSIPGNILTKASYIHENGNQGISKRLNQALNIANKEGLKFLLTMDQDSSFKEDEIKKYIEEASKYLNDNAVIAVGINVNYPSGTSKNEQNLLITSGTILNVKHSLKMNGFDEKLFIDYVDTEFCLRAWKNGFLTKSIEVKMNHEFGEQKRVWSTNLKKEIRRFHNPKRLYYLTRNFLYTRNLYPEFKIYLPVSYLFYEIKNAILYGRKPFSYIYHILLGMSHYLKHQMGK